MTEPKTVAEIAGKIGRTQKLVVLSLSEDWGPSANHQAAKRLWYRGDIPRLVDHKHCEDNVWCLTRIGRQVAAHLEGTDHGN